MNRSIPLFCFGLFVFLLIDGFLLSTAIGISFSVFIAIDFVFKLGKEVPIREFIILIASLQWIVGAKLSYNFGKLHHKYYMYVEEDRYMAFVVPSVILFYAGLMVYRKRFLLSEITNFFDEREINLAKGAKFLIGVGLASIIINRFSSGSFSFLFFLSELLLYIGIGYSFFIFKKQRYIIFFASVFCVFLFSLSLGVFHKLLLVTSFLSFFIVPKKMKFIYKLGFIALGLSFVYVIQAVKKDYREIVWKTARDVNSAEVFWNLVQAEFISNETKELSFNSSEEDNEQAEMNNRLNQGWIISKTLENVPKNTPFLHGRTISESIKSSLLPRFLFPEKAGAEQGLLNFKEVTGLPLHEKASMELSVVAEFYANYGYNGGLIAIFLYGCFLSFILRFIVVQLGHGSPLVFFWLILFFFQVVKAEIDLIKIINHLVKSIIFFMLFRYVMIQMGYDLFKGRIKSNS